jgi:signal transduction histidine kinase
MTTRVLLRIAGVLAWIFAGVPAIVGVARDPGCMPQWGHPLWLGAFVLFGIAFWRVSGSYDAGTSPRVTRLIAVQAAAALGMLVCVCTGFEAALLMVVAVQLGLLVPLRIAVPWLAVQSAAMMALVNVHMAHGFWWAAAMIAFESFAFVVAAIAGREALARRALAEANQQIEHLSRDRERVRIARELHDLLGHSLVALHLNLEAASHAAPSPPLGAAKDIAKGLLDDVRRAVGMLRDSGDLGARLEAMTRGIQQPKVHIAIGSALHGIDEPRGTALVRCVQELVTNAAKHAGASNLWIEIACDNGALEIRARDDGRGARSPLLEGNGLQGMRERVRALGGDVRFEPGEGQGFRAVAAIPVSDTAKAAGR